MKELIVPYIPSIHHHSPFAVIASELNKLPKHKIEIAPWKEFSYKPDVSFSIAYNEEGIFLKYFVMEKAIRAVYTQANEPVYKDSCVEFFISLPNDPSYYNLEFNCIGTCLMGYRSSRHNRTLLPEEVISKIRHEAIIENDRDGGAVVFKWSLILSIPLDVFAFHQNLSLQGQRCKANFYKCGDELPEPHYLCWNNIVSDKPDFHLPQYFGTLVFE